MTVRRNLAASVRQRLLARSRERREDFQVTLTRFAIERLLYRLERSAYGDEFILKGALLFTIWNDAPHRPTRDLDLLSRGANEIAHLEYIFREIIGTQVEPDGLEFLRDTVRGARIKEDQEYEGVRLTCDVQLERARVRVQVDVGFGDAVTPAPEMIDYPTLLDDLPAPRVRAYSRYTTIAEKFQAMVALDMANTRIKDFYDVHVLARTSEFDGVTLAVAIAATFKRRRTPLPVEAPRALTDHFGEDPAKQRLWRAFLSKGRLEADDKSFVEVIANLKEFLLPPAMSAARDETFASKWTNPGGWQTHGEMKDSE